MNKTIKTCPLCKQESLECTGHTFGYEDYDWDNTCSNCGFWEEQHYSTPISGIGGYTADNSIYFPLRIEEIWNQNKTMMKEVGMTPVKFWTQFEYEILKLGFEKLPHCGIED